MTTSNTLAQCAALINTCGPNSLEVQDFIDQHRENAEFFELANVARDLKRAVLRAGKKSPHGKTFNINEKLVEF